MISFIETRKPTLVYKSLSAFISVTFFLGVVTPPRVSYAQAGPVLSSVPALPLPGTMVTVSNSFTPIMVTGVTVHPDNPLEFDFIVDKGDSEIRGTALEHESKRLVKYFLATLTIPEDELWVNLSPYEQNRMIPTKFGETEMGQDMLAQDYLLKQLTASLMYPEDELGKKFWDRVYKKAYELYGTAEIPMNTFNKIWIVPENATVYQHENSAYVIGSHLKVMLEEDYVAMDFHQKSTATSPAPARNAAEDKMISGVTSDVVREVLIPEIEREVNEGATFANLRQIYNSMILATWYKKTLRDGLLGQVYVDRNKVKGVDAEDKAGKEKIYAQYLEAFEKGVYNYIKEDYDPATDNVVPRKYFSGGTEGPKADKLKIKFFESIPNMSANEIVEVLRAKSELTPGEAAFVRNALQKFTEQERTDILKRLNITLEQLDGRVTVKIVLVENAGEGEKGITVVTKKDENASSPVQISQESRMNTVIGNGVKNLEKSYQTMLARANQFAVETGIPEAEIINEVENLIYGPIFKATNKIAELIESGEIRPTQTNLRVSKRQPEQKSEVQQGRPLRVGFLPLKGDPWQGGHLWVILEAIAKYKLDKVIVAVDNSDPVRKPDLSSITIREPISQYILDALGDIVQYTPIAREELELLTADGETMTFFLSQLNTTQKIDWFYIAGSDHRFWNVEKNGNILADTAHKLKIKMDDHLYGFTPARGHTLSLILSERAGEPVTEHELMDLKVRASLKEVGKIIQPMDTSSTRVRKSGHFWTVSLDAFTFAKAFNMWGTESQEVKESQTQLAHLLREILMDSNFPYTARLKQIKVHLEDATGIAMNEFDKTVNNMLDSRTMNQRFLLNAREAIFSRGRQIVQSAVEASGSSPVRETSGERQSVKSDGEASSPVSVQIEKVRNQALDSIRKTIRNIALNKVYQRVLSDKMAPAIKELEDLTSSKNPDEQHQQLKIVLQRAVRILRQDDELNRQIKLSTSNFYDTKDLIEQLDKMIEQLSNAASSPVDGGDEFTKGGIDLNPALLDLQIRRDDNGIPLPVGQQPIYDMHIEGFLPVIINITPVAVSPMLLGLLGADDSLDAAGADVQAAPFDMGMADKYIRETESN